MLHESLQNLIECLRNNPDSLVTLTSGSVSPLAYPVLPSPESSDSLSPEGDVGVKLAEIWSDVLGVHRV
jgi:hypothetical protein